MPHSSHDPSGRSRSRRARGAWTGPGASSGLGFGFGSEATSYFQLWEQVTRAHLARCDELRERVLDPSYRLTDLSHDALQCWSDSVEDAAQLWCFWTPWMRPCSEVTFCISENDDTSDLRVVHVAPFVSGAPVGTPLQSTDGAHTIPGSKVFLRSEGPSRLVVQLIDLRPPPQGPDDEPAGVAPGTYRGFVVLEPTEQTLASIVVRVEPALQA